MSTRYLRLALLLILAGSGVGCALPEPLVRLNPRAPNVFWVAGRASVEKEDTGVRVAVAFEHQNGGLLGVRVEVKNQTDGAMDVKPQEFFYVTCGSDKVESCSQAKPEVDPEGVLAFLDSSASREQASAVNDQALLAPLLILSAVGDVASVASGHANGTTGLRTSAISQQMDSDAARHDSATASIGAQHNLWSNAALRRNTLLPGGGAAGLVYVPIEPNVRYLWLTVRAGGRMLPFGFEQVVVQVNSNGTTTASTPTRNH
jgi:hypothetical protein